MKNSTYHLLLVLYPDCITWDLEFGDYDRSVVKEERDAFRSDHKAKNMMLVTVANGKQQTIDEAIEKINLKEMSK